MTCINELSGLGCFKWSDLIVFNTFTALVFAVCVTALIAALAIRWYFGLLEVAVFLGAGFFIVWWVG